ncbi:hypothetical protein BD324DRAFT_583137 [Kockovaella imperatae]|uniref:Ornithine cyclodeaminase n=1 Tax=Kockovaella imperatae TaxID=4999 RepID=A0A1Y1UAT0_9TREE|nr:hypothetical protein BD324DRAFT_583137 [Kockovaella imperatae]ORX34654.1 hypothetical protein BD324DRAFT_583137 [Kockovaella imperatae]
MDPPVEGRSSALAGTEEAATESSRSLLILTARDVDKVLSTLDLKQAIESQRHAFSVHSGCSQTGSDEGEFTQSIPLQTPPRITLSCQAYTSLFMPSQVPSLGTGIKIVSVPSSDGQGLPATNLLLDETSGKVKAVINARKLTALRNAAGSALFLQTFPAPRKPTSLLIFGTGAQAYAHAVIILKLFQSIKSLIIVARAKTVRAHHLIEALRKDFSNVDITLGISDTTKSQSTDDTDNPRPPAGSEPPFNLSQAVHNANIILTLTPSTSPLFNAVDVTSHTRLVLVGSYKPSMREVSDELIMRSGVLVVDTAEGCLKEAGEVISSGIANVEGAGIIELGQCLGESDSALMHRERVEKTGDVVIFKSVGFGVQDIAITHLVLQEAMTQGLGTTIPDYD